MNRRSFLKTATAGLAANAAAGIAAPAQTERLGLTIWSYSHRWKQRRPDAPKPGWRNALDVLDHCHDLGAGCLQIGVRDWTNDFIGQVRNKRESLGVSLEGQVGLPRDDSDLARFESELRAAKEAGATILRTVCLGSRRYETFKSLDEWKRFIRDSRQALERAEPVLDRMRLKLAVENHKDWRIDEHLDLLKHLDSEWIGVNLDFGNNISLLEHPHDVAEALAPFVITTHVKDMALAEHDDGFLLSEVPLGDGILDMKRMMSACTKANPSVWFNLEMITRNPLRVPVFLNSYWHTMNRLPASDLARTLKLAKAGNANSLPTITNRNEVGRLEFEETNVRRSFAFAREELGFV